MIGFSTSDGSPCDFTQLGWRNIRLSQLVSFGPNLLVLLEADVPESPEHSTLGGLKGASFRVNPELRPVPRWASSYFNIARSRASTPQTQTMQQSRRYCQHERLSGWDVLRGHHGMWWCHRCERVGSSFHSHSHADENMVEGCDCRRTRR